MLLGGELVSLIHEQPWPAEREDKTTTAGRPIGSLALECREVGRRAVTAVAPSPSRAPVSTEKPSCVNELSGFPFPSFHMLRLRVPCPGSDVVFDACFAFGVKFCHLEVARPDSDNDNVRATQRLLPKDALRSLGHCPHILFVFWVLAETRMARSGEQWSGQTRFSHVVRWRRYDPHTLFKASAFVLYRGPSK